MKNQNVEITVKGGYDNSELKISIDPDSGIEKYAEVFRTILTHLTFHPNTIGEIISDEYSDDPDLQQLREDWSRFDLRM
jgi:hypothetical protein